MVEQKVPREEMSPKGVIRKGNKDLSDAHPRIIYSSREGETSVSSRKGKFL